MTSLVLFFHIFAGIIAALIAFPFAMLAKKGSNLHVLAGKVFLYSFLVICLTGYILDYQEMYHLFIANGLLIKEFYRNYTVVSSPIHLFFTASINTFATYLVISGWRIAYKHYKGNKTTFDKFFDVSLAIFLIAAVIVFFLTGLELPNIHSESKMHLHMSKQLFIVIGLISLGGLVEASLDILRAFNFCTPKKWWIVHMRKMFLAELGLVLAFIYRCQHTNFFKPLVIFSVLFFVALFTFMFFRQKNSNNKKLLWSSSLNISFLQLINIFSWIHYTIVLFFNI